MPRARCVASRGGAGFSFSCAQGFRMCVRFRAPTSHVRNLHVRDLRFRAPTSRFRRGNGRMRVRWSAGVLASVTVGVVGPGPPSGAARPLPPAGGDKEVIATRPICTACGLYAQHAAYTHNRTAYTHCEAKSRYPDCGCRPDVFAAWSSSGTAWPALRYCALPPAGVRERRGACPRPSHMSRRHFPLAGEGEGLGRMGRIRTRHDTRKRYRCRLV